MPRSASSPALASETHAYPAPARLPSPGLRAVPTPPAHPAAPQEREPDAPGEEDSTTDSAAWAFLSAHGRVLVCLCSRPALSIRQIAGQVGISTRTVHRVLGQLEAAGYLRRVRIGPRNRYALNPDTRLRHPLTSHQGLGALLAALTGRSTGDDDVEVPCDGE